MTHDRDFLHSNPSSQYRNCDPIACIRVSDIPIRHDSALSFPAQEHPITNIRNYSIFTIPLLLQARIQNLLTASSLYLSISSTWHKPRRCPGFVLRTVLPCAFCLPTWATNHHNMKLEDEQTAYMIYHQTRLFRTKMYSLNQNL